MYDLFSNSTQILKWYIVYSLQHYVAEDLKEGSEGINRKIYTDIFLRETFRKK